MNGPAVMTTTPPLQHYLQFSDLTASYYAYLF